ncbi:BTB/POZ domain protein [Dictyocaulus viviparus]|uniref:BTB/POZ domain protein n=1 Tax=Dictyocaulus viviparus TaxID=29172 RepID=A0A0D8Y099_DICVI|nr:BTB/POZ domain protein [Dictyocaulus viviparus]
MADCAGPLRPADSWSTTEVRSVTHSHVWTIKGFSQCECRYLETSAKIRDLTQVTSMSLPPPTSTSNLSTLEPPMLTFRIRLHPQGNKESNKDFSFFQCFSNQTNVQFKAKFKFTVFNSRNEEIPTTVYTGTQQLHGYFEYIRRDLLISHVHPSDELQLVLNMTVTFDTVTRTSQAPKTLGPPEPKPAEVTKDLESIFKDSKLSDFVIVVGDREIPVHKVVLSARSPVFAAMLEPHTEEAKTNRVVLEDMDYEVMHELLMYMYSGRSPNIQQMGLELLAAADRFQLPGLKEMADHVLRSGLIVDTACKFLVYADMYNSSDLKTEAVKFIAQNINSVIQTDTWAELTRDHGCLVTEIVAHMSSERKPCIGSVTNNANSIHAVSLNSRQLFSSNICCAFVFWITNLVFDVVRLSTYPCKNPSVSNKLAYFMFEPMNAMFKQSF